MMGIPYAKFANLRMRDFWHGDYQISPISGLESCLGMSEGEAINFSYFLWPPSRPGEVAEVRLEAIDDANCPAKIADAIMARIGLPLATGTSLALAEERLGPAAAKEPLTGDLLVAVFPFGAPDTYTVYGTFHPKEGLVGLIVVRTDLDETSASA